MDNQHKNLEAIARGKGSSQARDEGCQMCGEEESEFSGGIILPECPDCGQYCKIPDTYIASHKECYAVSYCKRCKKEVNLEVVFS